MYTLKKIANIKELKKRSRKYFLKKFHIYLKNKSKEINMNFSAKL